MQLGSVTVDKVQLWLDRNIDLDGLRKSAPEDLRGLPDHIAQIYGSGFLIDPFSEKQELRDELPGVLCAEL